MPGDSDRPPSSRDARSLVKAAWLTNLAVARATKNALSRFAPEAWAAFSRSRRVTGRGRGRDGATGMAYFRAVVDDYQAIAVHAGVVAPGEDLFRGRRVLEIGPGDTRAVALLARARGAESHVGLEALPRPERRGDPFSRIYLPLLRDEGLPATRAQAAALLDGSRVVTTQDELRASGLRFDLVVSRAALEHVHDLDALYETLRLVTTDDAVLIHKIDLRSHDTHFDNPLDFLVYPDVVYRLMSSHAFDMPNRVRARTYARLGERHGFALAYLGATHLARPEQVRAIRSRLAPPYCDMSEADLAILGAWVVDVGRRHPLAATSGGVPGEIPRAPLDKLSAY